MRPTIRTAIQSDAECISVIHVRAWQAAYRGLLPTDSLDAMTPEQSRPMWERVLEKPSGTRQVLVGEREGTLAGFSAFGRVHDPDASDDTFELFALYVAPDAQGSGIGTTLIETSLAAMRDAGARSAVLWVLEGNERAQQFYLRSGWVHGDALKDETVFGIRVRELEYTITLGI